MATLDDLLAVGNLPLLDKTTNRLPALVEATLPGVLSKGVAGGVAALNSQGRPVDTAGNAMAVIGTASGTAADAAVVAGQISAAQGAAGAAQTAATNAASAASSATAAATAATTAANNAAAAAASKVGTSADGSAVPQIRWYATKPTIAALQAANVPVGSVILVTAAT
jgi:hypothetical protein